MDHYEFKDEYAGMLSFDRVTEWLDREREFQSTLDPWDHRHAKMFTFEDDGQWLVIFWGGGRYEYEMDRLQRPEDLLWLVAHLAKKRWKHSTPSRIAKLIEVVSARKGWPPYEHAPHPNEAPKPNFDKIGERAKMTKAMRYAVIRRDGYRCRACGFAVEDGAHLHVDHIVAIANGGQTAMSNLQTLCTACNLGKGKS